MRVTSRLFTLGAVALLGLVSGCGSSTGTSSSATTTTTSSPTTTAAPQPSTAPATTAAPTATHPSAAATPGSKPLAGTAALITIKDFKFSVPASVGAGSKVTVMNKDGENHSVTSAGKGTFSVIAEAGGKPSTFTAPTKPGTYPFVCMFHANMKGSLVVR